MQHLTPPIHLPPELPNVLESCDLTREYPGSVLVAEKSAPAGMRRAEGPLETIVKDHKDDPVEAAGQGRFRFVASACLLSKPACKCNEGLEVELRVPEDFWLLHYLAVKTWET
jgi:hypothetical protein